MCAFCHASFDGAGDCVPVYSFYVSLGLWVSGKVHAMYGKLISLATSTVNVALSFVISQ